MTTTQIIFTGDEYEECNSSNSESLGWPVQDPSARWHYESFPGQQVCWHSNDRRVDFGFMAIPIVESDIPRDGDGELNFDGLFLCASGITYRAV